MAETALNFGPDWLRALAHGPTSTSQPSASTVTTIPKYSLAKYRYGREEMLALIPKDPKKPECLKRDTSKVVRETFVLPLALTPATEDEQRLWARSVNSDAVLRASGKSVPGNNMGRSGRGGSVDRGRGRGRGSYYQRGIAYEDTEDGPPTSFSRPKPIERSQSASEKDQRWDDRDRRFDRTFSGRGGGLDDASKSEQSRSSNDYWRKYDKEDETDWRSSNLRSDKLGTRGSWRNPVDKERRENERNPSTRSVNGNARNSSHPHQKTSGNSLPEWSVDELNEQDVVGTFDSSGAFLEKKMADNSMDDIYVSDDADEGMPKDSPEAKRDSSKKTPRKSSSLSQVNVSLKQNIVKQTENVKKKGEEFVVDKRLSQNSEPQIINKNLTGVTATKSADDVIKPNNIVQHHIVNNKKPDYIPDTLPNVPDVVKSTKSESVILSHVKTETSVPSATIEEDAFAHHKKATENMVAQWTEEEEQRVISQSTTSSEKDNKWYYQDPQGEIQGPFTSPEMLEWFSAGYFTMNLMVRRSCDEKFSQLGDLIKSWGRVPFMPGNSPPPIRVTPMTSSLPTPVTQTIVPNPVATPVSSQIPKQEEQLLALQQQLIQQQLMQQQLMLRQAQLQQLLAQLKQQDNFTSLNTQQQQQVLMQQFMAQQQIPRPNLSGVSDQPGLVEAMTPLPLPLLGLPMAPLLKNDLSLWNMTPPSNPWPMNVSTSQASNSIWDVEPSKQNAEETELEKQKRLAEEQEKLRKAEEERLAQEKEMEEKRKLEELRRKQQEEERLRKELQQKQEEERKRLEEQQRREEEKRRQEELRQLEEQKRKEEELRKQEELRKLEEQRLEELRRQEEQRRLEEMKKKEEERKQEELRKLEEQRKLEEKRKKEELQKKLEMEEERKRELERQKEAARLKEEHEQQLQRERQKQKEREEMELKRLKSQGPAWGIQNSQSDTQLSLADIQRLQEEKEKEEREERERARQQMFQQQALKQAQQSKNGLSWAKRSAESQPAVKSLAEIQQEEAERLAQQQRNQKPQAPAPVISSNAGVWGNASHLNRITAAPSWNMNNVSSSGFWDDALNSSTQVKKQPSKTNDSAFPALSNPEKPATTHHSNKSKNVRAKKEEDAVTKLFGNRKPTDEFTAWCTEALSTMPSSVDVPTFVAFLKDIESPYEVHDYVKSYLGDGKEPREFAKQFLDRRSKFRAKQTPAEENTLWGPAPAITPVVNKPNSQPVNDNDGNSNSKGKSRRRKNRMQKLDNSLLGFTVQSNPDRLNVGEIDHVEGM